jgi:hypothetical protein
VYPLVAFYDIHGRKGEEIFFFSVSDATRDRLDVRSTECHAIHLQFHISANGLEIRAVQSPKCIV